jgi:4-carboxymuconolactone decarboxylase
VTALDRPTTALIRLAAAVASGAPARIEHRSREAVEAGVPPVWGDELLLQSRLMVGYPRALTAAQVWRDLVGEPAQLPEGLVEEKDFTERGESTCRAVYGSNYEKLRHNVARLHPALDAWMVSEGYGRTLGRSGLDLVRRELCVIAQVTVLEAERQLHSHLRGALNAGASPTMIDETLAALGVEVAAPALARALALWSGLR